MKEETKEKDKEEKEKEKEKGLMETVPNLSRFKVKFYLLIIF